MNKLIITPLIFLFSIAIFSNIKAQAVHEVQVSEFVFTPDTVHAMVGDTIRWVWVNGTHTTTSESIPQDATEWNEPIDINNQTFDYVIEVPGDYYYICLPHIEHFDHQGWILVEDLNQLAGNSNVRDHEIKVYPNPVKADFQADITLNSPDKLKIEIINLMGRTVYSQTTDHLSAQKHSIDISVSNLENGVYIFQISGQELFYSGKILVK